jgi:hypothetical protein
MLVSQQELLPELPVPSSGPGIKSVCIPVEWRAVSFECRIKILAECAENAPCGLGPVRLRLREPAADYCRLEIFCGESGLCGVSASD